MISIPLAAVLIIFGVIFTIGIIAVVLVFIAHCKRSCNFFKKENVVASNTQIITLEPAKNTTARNYVVLEDHLEELVSSSTRLRQPIEEVILPKEHAEQIGITLEFLPDDNTVIKIESTDFKVTRITKTKIILGDRQKTCRDNYHIHRGNLDGQPVSIHVISLRETAYGLAKQNVMRKDRNLSRLTPHPRYVRYHGTCFHPFKHEAYIITDYFAGASLLEIVHEPQIKEVMCLTEEEKIQSSADLVEAVYFIHGHSPAVIHGAIGLACAVIDGETHRGKMMSPEVRERIDEFLNFTTDGNSGNFLLDSGLMAIQEKPPELMLAKDFTVMSTEKTDIWSLGATILQFILDAPVWDISSLVKKFNVRDSTIAIKNAMELKLDPSILKVLIGANPKLQFLNDCLSYTPDDRPTAAMLSRRLNQLTLEIIRDRKKVSILRNPLSSSFLFPGRRGVASPVQRNPDPLIRQQVEWNVKQEAGYRRRSLVVGIRNYLGKKFKSLSVTSLNDIKDMTTLLQQGGYGLENTYENVRSSEILEDILTAYVESLNKEPEEVDMLVFFYAGKAIQGLPKKLVKKQDLGIFMDRTGIVHDLALVMGNESLFPVSKVQTILSDLNPKVKRKLLILDCRISKPRERFQPKASFSRLENNTLGWRDIDWELGAISEETIDRLATMFTIYPRIEDSVTEVAMDSHPSKTNGFLTGCLLTVIKDSTTVPYIEELPRGINSEMQKLTKNNKAFRGIQCVAGVISLEMDLWSVPLIGVK